MGIIYCQPEHSDQIHFLRKQRRIRVPYFGSPLPLKPFCCLFGYQFVTSAVPMANDGYQIQLWGKERNLRKNFAHCCLNRFRPI